MKSNEIPKSVFYKEFIDEQVWSCRIQFTSMFFDLKIINYDYQDMKLISFFFISSLLAYLCNQHHEY